MVHASQGNVPPISNKLMSETRIVANIANAVLKESSLNWMALADDYQLIRDIIAEALPAFKGFNKEIEQPGGFYLGNSAAELNWLTATQKANFSANELPQQLVAQSLQEEQEHKQLFTLQSLRSHDQYNTTIYGMNDRYRGIKGKRNVLFINEKDAKKQGFNDGDLVDITSVWHNNQYRQVSGFVLCFYDIPRGNLAAYYPETNPLVPLDSVGDDSFTPTSKSVAVFLEQHESHRIV